MKIEIEFEEVESLKNQLYNETQKVRKLEEKLKSLDEKQLNKKAIGLSYKLCEDYLVAIFTKLGFDEKQSGLVVEENLEHWIGKDWYTRDERINLKFNILISNEFKKAVISLGVNPKEN
jgi:hypothetical protein